FDLFNATANDGYLQHVLDDGTWQIASIGSAATRMVISPAGNVGIGTINPTSAKLQVEGGAGFGVYGTTSTITYAGVYGVSTATNSFGVRGTANQLGGVGVQGEAANGFAMAALGNAYQQRDKGGWVKAMLYVDADGNITRCYNALTGSSAANGTPDGC